MHVYVKEGEVDYRTARPVAYPQSAAGLFAGDVREDSRVGIQEALRFAEEYWGDRLYDTAPTFATRPAFPDQRWSFRWGSGDTSYKADSMCEVYELAWGLKV
jgi:hypothetical protein